MCETPLNVAGEKIHKKQYIHTTYTKHTLQATQKAVEAKIDAE